MYNYEWDPETGGYNLTTKLTGVIKEIRPVFRDELVLLGFDKKFDWKIPETDEPLMWSEIHRYIYKGVCVGEAVGGGLYDMPTIKSEYQGLEIEPVDVKRMVEKNKGLMDGLVQRTLHFIYDTYKFYSKKVGMFYIAFSGGKDSIVMLDLVQRALPHDEFVVIFGDTTMEMSATYKAFDIAQTRWNTLNWHRARADFDATESWKKIGYPARKLRWCCSVHKTAPSIMKIKEIIDSKEMTKKPLKVMVFDGVRAEESEARASYSMISEGSKHTVQFNCSPIFEWNTSELFIYILEYDLIINDLYRKGASRVGCKLCPMASNWYECILNHAYPEELEPLLNILYTSIKKDFPTEEDKKKYFQDGGWKSRIGGRELAIGENKITEINDNGALSKVLIKHGNYRWNKWLPTIGDLYDKGNGAYTLTYKNEITLTFDVVEKEEATVIYLQSLPKTKLSIRFMYLFKNAIYKSAYCVNCMECMAECAFGALKITKNDIEIKKCKHCESCLDSWKGCIVARSLGISGGGNNLSTKNISRYQNFGFRQEWLELYFQMREEDFWNNERMGTYMITGFKVWLKESGLTEGNAITNDGIKIQSLGSDSPLTWAYIFINLAYASPITNWYVLNTEYDRIYQANDLNILLGDAYSPTTIKNALSSLKETLRFSPVGWMLGQGDCEMKGKTVSSIIRYGWSTPEPLAILYALFKFAEKSDGLYSFTISDLYDESAEREGITPYKLFNIKRENCKEIIEILARDYSEFIRVNFNKDMMEDIYLESNKTAADVVQLF